MSGLAEDPRCPECGGPIGQTATYCMHCSTDLTEERSAADDDGNRVWDQAEAQAPVSSKATETDQQGLQNRSVSRITDHSVSEVLGSALFDTEKTDDQLLAPEGVIDNTLTVMVGITGGLIVGVVGTVVLGLLTSSIWSLLFGLLAWLGTTAYLVRRRTIQAAIAKSSYAVGIVLLLVPVIALSPAMSIEGGLADRGSLFFVLLMLVVIPAGIAGAIGWVASRFIPEPDAKVDE